MRKKIAVTNSILVLTILVLLTGVICFLSGAAASKNDSGYLLRYRMLEGQNWKYEISVRADQKV